MEEKDENLKYSNFYDNTSEEKEPFDEEQSLVSNISFSNYIHYLCRECFNVPEINLLDIGELKVKCKCNLSGKIISIKDFTRYLIRENEMLKKNEDNISKKVFTKDHFKCKEHKKKFLLYCQY